MAFRIVIEHFFSFFFKQKGRFIWKIGASFRLVKILLKSSLCTLTLCLYIKLYTCASLLFSNTVPLEKKRLAHVYNFMYKTSFL